MIYNKTFKIKKTKGSKILDTIINFFEKNLKNNQEVIRWAIVSVRGENLIVEASVREE